MNWKNAVMQILEAFGDSEGHWAEASWNLPEQEKLFIKREYQLWYNKKNEARIANETERRRIEQVHGKPNICSCEQNKNNVDGWICKTHGPMTPDSYDVLKSEPSFNDKFEEFLKRWYEDHGANFVPEQTVETVIYKYGGHQELKDVYRFPSISAATSCLHDLEKLHPENSYNISGDIIVIIRDRDSILGIIVKYNGKALFGQAERVFQFLTEEQCTNCFTELTEKHPQKCYERRNGVLLIVRAKNDDESENCSLVDEPEPGLNKVQLP